MTVTRRQIVSLSAAGLVLPLVILAGCGANTLETGYRYRPLNASASERRAFYADPFSVESQRASAERGNQVERRGGRPGL